MDTAEQKRQKDLERLHSLRPMDDDFMRCLFKDNIPLAEMVLRIITPSAWTHTELILSGKNMI